MCKCLQDFLEDFKQRYPTWKGKSVKDVFFPEGFDLKEGKSFVYLPIYIDVGLKNPKESALILHRCPIRGEEDDLSTREVCDLLEGARREDPSDA
jgi:hypothetical protein